MQLSLSFDGGFTVGGESTLAILSADSLTFNSGPAPIAINQNDGDFFAPFNSAAIGEIISFGTPPTTTGAFLDFGSLPIIPGVIGFGGEGTIVDGIDIFTLASASFEISDLGENATVNIALQGTFTNASGDSASGAGNITLQQNNISTVELENILNSGGSIESSFSGSLFITEETDPVSVPFVLDFPSFVGSLIILLCALSYCSYKRTKAVG